MTAPTGQSSAPLSTGVEARKGPPSIWSFLGSIAGGVLALGWVALWVVDAGTCSLEGIIWECHKGALVTEVNIVIAGALVLFGLVALLRGIAGLVTGAWRKEPA